MAMPAEEKFFRQEQIAAHKYLPSEAKALFHSARVLGMLSVDALRAVGEKMSAAARPFEAKGRGHYFESDLRKLWEANRPKTAVTPEAVKKLVELIGRHAETGPQHVDYSPQEFREIIDLLAPDRVTVKTLSSGFATAVLFFRPTSAGKAQAALDFVFRNKAELEKALHMGYEPQEDEEGRKAHVFSLVPRGSQAVDWINELSGTKRKRTRTARMWRLPGRK
ncbi:MAG: hypothetical protein AB1626_04780 [Candidatus Micrarchaeota archaeon]